MTYTSINNQKIKDLNKLKQKKYRDKENLFLIEGRHLVEEAYKEGILKEVFILEDNDIDLDTTINYASKEVINYLSEVETNQNIIGVCKKIEKKELSDKILILDNIQDPGNLGTIIRSSVAFNFNTIILSNDTVDLYNSKVIRASQGMIFKLNIIKDELKEIISNLKEKDYYILATKVNDGKNIKTLEKRKKICIIMGNEGNGVSEDILSLADEFINIEMNNNCESLNVAVATSILLYELNKEEYYDINAK